MSDLQEIGINLFMVAGFGVFLWGIKDLWRVGRIFANRGISVAQVVKTRLGREGDAYTVLQFVTDDNRTVRYEQNEPLFIAPVLFAHSKGSYYAGRSYKVHYDKANPRRATVSPVQNLCYALVLMVLGAAIIHGVATSPDFRWPEVTRFWQRLG